MSGRTKTMGDSVVWDEIGANHASVMIDYQPGNCTRYLCSITRLDLSAHALMLLGFAEDEPAGVFQFSWLNARRGGSCVVLRNDGYLAPGYLAEKLGCGLADAAVLAELIAHHTKRDADSALEAPQVIECDECESHEPLTDAHWDAKRTPAGYLCKSCWAKGEVEGVQT